MLSIMLIVFAGAAVITMTALRVAAHRPTRAVVARQSDDELDARARRSGL
ncbi:MAG TPA: hypothetical protein VF925_04095 [Casimicrobiaceae bacterium]|jgi:hypothetical protein